jgi:hypothetical protein
MPFGLGIGLPLGLIGGRGSILAVPVLVYVLGQPVKAATTESLLIVGTDGTLCRRARGLDTAAARRGAPARSPNGGRASEDLGIPAIGVGALPDGEAAAACERWPSTEERRLL